MEHLFHFLDGGILMKNSFFHFVSVITPLILFSTFCLAQEIKLTEDQKREYIEFSDYNYEPLKLFLSAIQEYNDETFPETLNEILEKYPKSKITPFVQYLLGRYYEYKFKDEKDREKAIINYQKVIRNYPNALYPKNDFPIHFCRAGELYDEEIAPIAQMHIAWLYDLYGDNPDNPMRDTKQAITEYRKVITNYTEKVSLCLTAYIHLLSIYREENNEEKFQEIGNILISKYGGQSFRKGSWGEWGVVEPEVLIGLAEFEEKKGNHVAAIKIYKKVLIKFSDASKTFHGGPEIYYSNWAIDGILNLINDDEKSIQELKKIQTKIIGKRLKGYLQFKIAYIYDKKIRDQEKATDEYKKFVENYDFNQHTYGMLDNEATEKLQELQTTKNKKK